MVVHSVSAYYKCQTAGELTTVKEREKNPLTPDHAELNLEQTLLSFSGTTLRSRAFALRFPGDMLDNPWVLEDVLQRDPLIGPNNQKLPDKIGRLRTDKLRNFHVTTHDPLLRLQRGIFERRRAH